MGDAKTAAEKTLANAVETGILKRNKVVPRLNEVRDKLESIAGKDVDLSIVRRGGNFDHGPPWTLLSHFLTLELIMNDALFCSIYVDSSLPRDATASLVAELAGGAVVRGGVDFGWGRIAIDDDYGTFEIRVADPDDFLGWPTLLEIMPSDSARREDVVPAVASLMKSLITRGIRVLAQCDYAEELPGGGEVAGPTPAQWSPRMVETRGS